MKSLSDFIGALSVASSALDELSTCWGQLSVSDCRQLNELGEWGEAFNVSLEDVPYILWAIVDKLEKLEKGK